MSNCVNYYNCWLNLVLFQVSGKTNVVEKSEDKTESKKSIKRCLSPSQEDENTTSEDELTLLGNITTKSNEHALSKKKKKKLVEKTKKSGKQKVAELEQERVRQ